MQDQSDSQTSVASRPTVRNELRDEFFGLPCPSGRAQFSVIAFGLLLVAAVVIPVFSDTEPMPGYVLVTAGMMMLMGFAELMDASHQQFITAVRGGGLVIALLGFAIQLL